MSQKVFDTIFPLWRHRNIAMFYILSAVYNMWFIAGVWVFVWNRFITTGQIGIADAIAFSVGFLVELPSGVFADLIGRKKAIIIGNVLLTLGNFFMTFSSSFWPLTLWFLTWTIGYAFQSGATEALVYDSVKKLGQEAKWPKVIATSIVIGRTTLLTAVALGGFLYSIWFRLPYLAFAVSGIAGIVAALLLHDIPVIKTSSLWSVNTYIKQIKDGVSVLTKLRVLPISLISLTVAGFAFIYNWGILRPLTGERFGYTPVTFPLLLSVISLLVILSTVVLVKLRKRLGLESLLLVSAGAYSLLFFLMGFPNTWLLGGLIMIALTIASAYVDQLFSQFINAHTPEAHRATTLSAVALFTRLPYVILTILIGTLAQNNLLPQFTLVVGVVAMCVWAYSLYRFTNLKTSKR